MTNLAQTLRRAVVTERSTELRNTRNQLVFEVDPKATKAEIRNAIEKAFKVKVVRVNTMIVPGKVKRVAAHEGKLSSWKKAVVLLKAGDKIEMMEGV